MVAAGLLCKGGRKSFHLPLQLQQLLRQRAVLPHPGAHLFHPFKVHHLQRRKGSVRVGGVEEAQLVALLGGLVLRQAAEGALFGGADHDIKDRLPAAQLHPAHGGHGLCTQTLRREGHELALAALPGDTEHPLLVVELPHQLNDKVALPCKGTVGALEHIPAQLAARLLQGGDGTGSGHAAGGAALRQVAVAADLLQFLDAAVAVAQAVALQASRLQRTEAFLVQAAHNVHDVPAQVGKLLLVHPSGIAEHIPLAGGQQHVLVHGVVHLINGILAVLHHVDVAEPGRGILLHEQRVEHKGILAVVVQSARRQRRVVLAGIQHHAVAKLAVVQTQFAVLVRALIVPVHHHALVGGGLAILVDVPGHVHHPGGVPCQLRVLRGQPGSVL